MLSYSWTPHEQLLLVLTGARTPEVSQEEVDFFLRHTCALDEDEVQNVYFSFGASRHAESPTPDSEKHDPTWGQPPSRKRQWQPAAAENNVSHIGSNVDLTLRTSVIKWGAISKEKSEEFGAHSSVCSVVLQPVVAHMLLRQKLFNWIPADFFPVAGANK